MLFSSTRLFFLFYRLSMIYPTSTHMLNMFQLWKLENSTRQLKYMEYGKKINPDIDISIQGVCDVCIIGYLQNNDHWSIK